MTVLPTYRPPAKPSGTKIPNAASRPKNLFFIFRYPIKKARTGRAYGYSFFQTALQIIQTGCRFSLLLGMDNLHFPGDDFVYRFFNAVMVVAARLQLAGYP